MDKQKRFTRPFLLALALHFTLLGLFALSAVYKPKAIEPKLAPPAPEIIHATMIDTASLQAQAEAVKQAKAAKNQAEKEKLEADAAKEKAEIVAKQAALEKASAAEAAEQTKTPFLNALNPPWLNPGLMLADRSGPNDDGQSVIADHVAAWLRTQGWT